MQQSLGANTKVYLAAAAVNQQANANELAAVLLNNLHNLFNAAASGYDIFNNQHAGTSRNLEATTQSHLAVFTLGEDSAGAQSLANLVSQQNSAGHRANYQLNVVVFITTSDFLAQALGIFRMLQYVEFFNIHRAVQTAGQQKVTMENCFSLLEHFQYVFFF